MPALLIASLFVSGCESLTWYGQAAKGQLSLLNKAEPVSEVLQDPNISAQLKYQLALSQSMIDFAERELDLPLDGKFRKYVELERPYAVWNVFAAEEFSVNAMPWCYWVVGCVSYRGYFSETDAQEKAQELKTEGYEVYIGGIAAYSTLGWFDDPLLSSFINRNELSLARLIFHELSHSKFFVKGDTVFNESFAEFVADQGVQAWVAAKGENASDYQATAQQQRALAKRFNQLLLSHRTQLETLYSDAVLNIEEKRRLKQGIFDALNQSYEIFKTETGASHYDKFMYEQMNNAKLAIVSDYQTLVPVFSKKFSEISKNGGTLTEFYLWINGLTKLSRQERHKKINDQEHILSNPYSSNH